MNVWVTHTSFANLKVLEAVPGHAEHYGPVVREYLASKVADIVRAHQSTGDGIAREQQLVQAREAVNRLCQALFMLECPANEVRMHVLSYRLHTGHKIN